MTAMSSSIHVLEGEGDASSKKKKQIAHACRSSPISKHAKLQPHWVRVMLSQKPDHISGRFGSLGLNLATERLLLGMQDGGPSEFP
jgi:hypothetical protein